MTDTRSGGTVSRLVICACARGRFVFGGPKMRSRSGRLKDDKGFSLVEIMFATLILFFVATALLGLASTTTMVAVSSKQQGLMVNAVTSYIEQLKALPYADLGMASPSTGQPAGTLPAETTMTVESFLVTLRPTVQWVDDPNIAGSTNYKLVRIEAEAVHTQGGHSVTYTSETYVRNPESGWGWGESKVPPQIDFGVGSPAANAVVSGTSVLVRATASSPMTNGLLASMSFYSDGFYMRNSLGAGADFNVNAKSHVQDFYWDTTAEVDDGNGNMVKTAPDGIRAMKIEVWDNVGQQSYKVRQVLVDNQPPSFPGLITMTNSNATQALLSWDAVQDGTDPAYKYFVGVDEDQGTGSWIHVHERCGEVIGQTTYAQPAVPFRRYRGRLFAQTPTNVSSGPSYSYYITRPRLTGQTKTSHNNAGAGLWTTTFQSVSITGPGFPTGGVTYRLYRSTNANMSGKDLRATQTATTFTLTSYTDVGKKNSSLPTRYYYQVEATFTPTGPNGGTQRVLNSNIVGPSADVDANNVWIQMGEIW